MPVSAERAGVDLHFYLNLFNEKQNDMPQESGAICAVETLLSFLKESPAKTLQELVNDVRRIKDHLCREIETPSTPVRSGCELFLRFVTLANQGLEETNFEKTKQLLVERGRDYFGKCSHAKPRIARLGAPFLPDGATVLTHSRSRVVAEVLKAAVTGGNRVSVYVTQSAPDDSGLEMKRILDDCGISTTVILDSAVAYIMEKVDVVLVGAEAVVESGGVVNKIGTYGVAIAAHALKKPFYVAAEHFKFAKLFPLSQADLPDECKYKGSVLRSGDRLEEQHPLVDYTPPEYITLLFTDLGVLTPTAVSEYLIDLYL